MQRLPRPLSLGVRLSGGEKLREAPREIGGARVICSTPIDERHRPTRSCRHIIVGAVLVPTAGLAICQFEGDNCYYLFGCSIEWQPVTDTWHATIEEAMSQAEFEYVGVSATWRLHGA
jgi:hypothetical protein